MDWDENIVDFFRADKVKMRGVKCKAHGQVLLLQKLRELFPNTYHCAVSFFKFYFSRRVELCSTANHLDNDRVYQHGHRNPWVCTPIFKFDTECRVRVGIVERISYFGLGHFERTVSSD